MKTTADISTTIASAPRAERPRVLATLAVARHGVDVFTNPTTLAVRWKR